MNKEQQQEQRETPNCIGFILDGNRRWAKERGLPTLEGHRVGLLKKLLESLSWMQEENIPYFIFYMFSTENWSRHHSEVTYLMDLFREVSRDRLGDLKKQGIKAKFIGQRHRFARDLQSLMTEVEQETKDGTNGTAVFALSYGGRAEIVHAINRILKEKESITEEEFGNYLWTAGIPDPDLIIRTGGVMRLSNFLPWQSVYSELFFTDTLWPDFSKEEFCSILKEYTARERRYGK